MSPNLTRAACTVAALIAAAAGVAALAPPATAGPASFMTGFADSIWESTADPNPWFDRTAATNADFVLLPVRWSAIAARQPTGDATDPANPAYDWGNLDQAVKDAAAHGLTVGFTIAPFGGPPWADGPGRPANVTPGTWDPQPSAFGAFVEALARRFSGSFEGLPRVRYYEPWSEPNLDNHLMPQWVRSHGHWLAESPLVYRALLNAAYTAVKSVHRSDLVISAGTAPFGDPPGGRRVPPAEFVRDLLCLSRGLKPGPCRNPAHFDILAHHPYSIGGPWWRALNPDDVALPDLWKLTRALHAAERTGRALPRGRKQVWVTEFSWDSKPPDPHAIPMATWEHWMEESFYVLWSQGVDAVAWYLLRDQPCTPGCQDTYQSGLYFLDGQAKPAIDAFRFPFVVEPTSSGRALIWGLAPRSGTVVVQIRQAGRWRTVTTFRRPSHAIFTRAIGAKPGELLRAKDRGDTSLTWRLARDHCHPSAECNVFSG